MDENENKGDLLQKEVKSSENEIKDDKIHTGENDLPEIKIGEDVNKVIRSESENGNVDTSKSEDTEDIECKSNNIVVNTESDTSETKNSEEINNEVDKSEDTNVDVNTETEIVGQKDTEISQSENNNPDTEISNSETLEVKNGNDENLSVLSSEPTESDTINSEESETKKARNDDIKITGELSQTTTEETKEVEKEEEIKDDVKDLKTESTESNTSKTNVAPVIELRHMLEDIEEGELDYDEEDTDMGDGVEDLPDLPEYDPSANDKGERGEIVSDNNNDDEREEGEIADDEDDEGGQVYICVDPLNDKWKKMSKADQKDLEEGQIEDDEEVKKASPKLPSPGRFIPRTLCKYYKNGLCRWGSTCRFLHPGVNDQGIPSDVQPTWNATAGNYVMHRPPGMYPNAFGKAPPPMECINVPVMPAPVVDMSLLSTVGHSEIVAVPVAGAIYPEEMPVRRESAWEKGLRRAKEIKEAGARRRREDADFEKKKLSMRITETVHDESNFEPVPAYPGEKTYDELNIDDYGKSVDYPEHRHRDERRSRYSRTPKEPSLDRSSGRARIAELPSSHPMRREERQRLRERERREKAEKNDVEPEREFRRDTNTQIKISSKSMSSKVNVTDPRVRSSFKQTSNHSVKTPLKTTEPTEWHDPWMRTQQTATAQLPKTDLINKSGVEAISDSDSSSSDSDSDSDSSSSSKSSGSKSVGHSSGSDTEKKSKQHNYSSSGSKVSDSTRKEPRPFQQQPEEKSGKVGKSSEKNEPLSYEEWKRLQTIQKAQYHQQMANQYKNNLGGGEAPGRDNSSDRHKERFMKQSSRIEEDKRNTYPNNQRPLSSTLPGRHEQISKPAAKTSSSLPPKDISMVNDDKFDSPKRATQSDSDSGSDSNSGSDSDSSGSDTDSDDSDSDSDSDTAMPSAPPSAPSGNNKTGSSIKFGQMDAFAKKVALAEKAKPVEAPVSTLAGKRPARKDELLKELKAVEDAIARKRAKID